MTIFARSTSLNPHLRSLLRTVVRVLISLTVIMITCTGLPYLVTPFMVATVFARVSGQWLLNGHGIYDIILAMKGIPFLEETSPTVIEYHGLRAKDIMSSPITCLDPEMRVRDLVDMLRRHQFLDFPVTDPTRGGRLVGVVKRVDVLTVLCHSDLFYPKDAGVHRKRALKDSKFVHKLNHGPSLERSIDPYLAEDDLDRYVNLTPYLQVAPYTFDQNGSAPRAYELFRLLGLRTLIITGGPDNAPVGIVSRNDLKILEELSLDDDHLASIRGRRASYQTVS